MEIRPLVIVLCLAASGQALKCYVCKNAGTPGAAIGTLTDIFKSSPPCSEFNATNPDDSKFLKECPADMNSTCIKATNPTNNANLIRGCSDLAEAVCKINSFCCSTDACNGSERGWPSAVLLLSALAAALVGGR